MTVGASAQTAWDRLSAPWQAAFDEAWTSWCHGCFGIGAVAVDETGDIVARGRNRVLEPKSEPGVLAELALERIGGGVLTSVRDGGGSAVDAMASVWNELV